MGTIWKLVVKELKKKKAYTLLTFIVCLIAMNTIFSSITNATSAVYQKKHLLNYQNMQHKQKDYH